MIDKAAQGVLLLAHGAPRSPEEIPAFLTSVRGGREMPAAAVAAYEDRYRRIGGSSPMARIPQRIAEALARRLGRPVVLGMRHGAPSIADALREAQRAGVQHLVAACLTPYGGQFAAGAYRAALARALAALDVPPTVDFVADWHREPAFLEGLTTAARKGLAGFPPGQHDAVMVVFSAHSVPMRALEREDPYPEQVSQTAASVAERLGLDTGRWQLAYQSAPANSAMAWLGPDLTATVLAQAHRQPTVAPSRVLVVPIGFVIENLETLYDLDIELKETASAAGLHLRRAPLLDDGPALIEALAAVIQTRQTPEVPNKERV